MTNNIDADDFTSAFEVMIGDPIEIGGSGASFSVGEAAIVPEPGSLAPLAFGGRCCWPGAAERRLPSNPRE